MALFEFLSIRILGWNFLTIQLILRARRFSFSTGCRQPLQITLIQFCNEASLRNCDRLKQTCTGTVKQNSN